MVREREFLVSTGMPRPILGESCTTQFFLLAKKKKKIFPLLFSSCSQEEFSRETSIIFVFKILNKSVNNCDIVEFYCWLSSSLVSVNKSFQVSFLDKKRGEINDIIKGE